MVSTRGRNPLRPGSIPGRKIPYSVMANTSVFPTEARGSIPRTEAYLFQSLTVVDDWSHGPMAR